MNISKIYVNFLVGRVTNRKNVLRIGQNGKGHSLSKMVAILLETRGRFFLPSLQLSARRAIENWDFKLDVRFAIC